MTWAGPTAAPTPDVLAPAAARERYVDLAPLGRGGMGELRRVQDTWFDATVAMKILAPRLVDSASARASFIHEAQLLARLRHPGVVAVHDRGEQPDGRLWYTMTEVTGGTLQDAYEHLPAAFSARHRSLLGVLARVSEVVAYAHDQGVVHRDLKPANLMLGDFGEVFVMDWGIATDMGTWVDEPVGTPRYMAPEQAAGGGAAAAADVYALGVLLHELLTGRTLLRRKGLAAVEKLRTAPPTPFPDGVEGIPSSLADTVRAAVDSDPSRRPSAQGIASSLRNWLEGQARAQEARQIVARAEARAEEARTLRVKARALRAKAKAERWPAQLRPEEEAFHAVWAAEDDAERLAQRVGVLEARWLQEVGSALNHDPDCAEAHAALADHYAARLVDAELDRRTSDARVLETYLLRHDRGQHQRLLDGHGTVTLRSTPTGAQVTAYRVVEQQRLLVEVEPRDLGATPLEAVELPRGSWVFVLEHPECEPVRYPVFLRRGGDWDGAVDLPQRGSLGSNDAYVPAGPFLCGAEQGAMEPFPRHTRWLESFVIQRRHVTVEEFAVFLRDLRDRGEDWERWAPRVDGGVSVDEALRRVSALGDPASVAEHPITGVCQRSALAYGRWWSERTGQPWTLATELQWEKAARGADGRAYPWGDTFHGSRANVPSPGAEEAWLRPAGAFPLDGSVYGVVDLAGNAVDWCWNGWSDDPDRLVAAEDGGLAAGRGGTYITTDGAAMHGASRLASPSNTRWRHVSFRLARSASA